jgi:hypothetical protein
MALARLALTSFRAVSSNSGARTQAAAAVRCFASEGAKQARGVSLGSRQADPPTQGTDSRALG